jgi:hypothetical protein
MDDEILFEEMPHGGAIEIIELAKLDNLLKGVQGGFSPHGDNIETILGMAPHPKAKLLLKTLASYKQEFAWIDLELATHHVWLPMLVDSRRRMRCNWCAGCRFSCSMDCVKSTLSSHAASDHHKKAVVAHSKWVAGLAKQTLLPAGGGGAQLSTEQIDERQADALTAFFVASGISYTNVCTMFNGSPQLDHLLKRVSHLPSTTKSRETSLPGVVKLIDDHNIARMARKYGSINIDAAATKQMSGTQKVLTCTFASKALEDEPLIHVELIDHAERGVDVVATINKIKTKYPTTIIAWFGGDGATVNSLGARLAGIPFAPCPPHAAALPVHAFCADFPQVQKLLVAIRGFVHAGGSVGRAGDFIMACLSVTSLDFVITRWVELIKAVDYLLGDQTDHSIYRRLKMLRRRAEVGGGGAAAGPDPAAAAALAAERNEPKVRLPVWIAIDEFVSAQQQDPDGENQKTLVLNMLRDPKVYAEVILIKNMFGKVPQLMALMQGSPQYNSAHVDPVTGANVPAVNIGAELMGLITLFDYVKNNHAQVAEAVAVATGNFLTIEIEHLKTRAVVTTLLEANRAPTVSWCRNDLSTRIRIAATTALTDDRRARIMDCIKRANSARCFDINIPPQLPPVLGKDAAGSDVRQDAATYLGFPRSRGGDVPALTHQWAAHVASYVPLIQPLSNKMVYAYWESKLEEWNILADWALRAYNNPYGNGRNEGMNSYLEKMSAPSKRSAEETTFMNEYRLRCARHLVVDKIVPDAAVLTPALLVRAMPPVALRASPPEPAPAAAGPQFEAKSRLEESAVALARDEVRCLEEQMNALTMQLKDARQKLEKVVADERAKSLNAAKAWSGFWGKSHGRDDDSDGTGGAAGGAAGGKKQRS